MSRRQYVGARYVPKYFDWDGSNEWKSGVTYEALTIVTRNGNNYTSKIPVPSNVGEPENNPEYWVLTGMSDEQIESLRQDLTVAQGDINELKEDLSEVKRAERINILDLMQTNGGIYATDGGDNNSGSVVSAFRRTDYIPVSAGDVVEYYRIRADGMCIIAFYTSGITFDANNSVIGDSTPLSGTWMAPSDGVIRACCRITEIQSGRSYAYADYNLYRQLQKNEDFPNVVSHGFTQIINMVWSVGFISASTGEISSGASAIITRDYYTLEEKPIIIRKPLNTQLQIYAYSDGSFTRTGVDSAVTQFTFTPSSAMTYRFCYYRLPYETADIETFKNDIAIGYEEDLFVTSLRYSDVSGKKWVTIGDSLTDTVTLSGYSGEETKNYTNIVAERLGLTLSNVGVSGSGYWRKSTVSPYKGFYQVAQTIPTDADIVTLFGSFNDMGSDGGTSGRNILGTIYDDGTDTVGGCVNQAIKNVITRVPNAVIGIILPTPWNAMTQTASELATYEAYVNLVKGVAERYSLPVLDLFHHSNLRPWDDAFKSAYYKDADGVHPNHYGHMRIAGYIADFVESLAKLN